MSQAATAADESLLKSLLCAALFPQVMDAATLGDAGCNLR